MTSDDPRSNDFDYKKYSLNHVDEWVHDALNCENTTPQEIYDTITNAVDENIEYHKKYLTKNIELLSLLKGHRSNVFDASAHDFDDFWYSPEAQGTWGKSEHYDDFECPLPSQYTEEEMDAMCERAAVENDKEKCREYNLREAEYYDKRAQLDLEATKKQLKIARKIDEGKSEYYYDTGRNKTYDQMLAEGWEMTDDGFWIKEVIRADEC